MIVLYTLYKMAISIKNCTGGSRQCREGRNGRYEATIGKEGIRSV